MSVEQMPVSQISVDPMSVDQMYPILKYNTAKKHFQLKKMI
jgi:hypothetical protein